MTILFDRQLGWTECGVCGNSTASMLVEHDEWASWEHPYRFTVRAGCHGDHEFANLTRAELLEKIEEWRFLVQTRPVRKRLNAFVKRIKAGHFSFKTKNAIDLIKERKRREQNRIDVARRAAIINQYPTRAPEARDLAIDEMSLIEEPFDVGFWEDDLLAVREQPVVPIPEAAMSSFRGDNDDWVSDAAGSTGNGTEAVRSRVNWYYSVSTTSATTNITDWTIAG